MMGPYLVFLSSTVNGYEGTGRSLSLKLVKQLRQQSSSVDTTSKEGSTPLGKKLFEITLDESVRYSPNDPIEQWLNQLLCLDCGTAASNQLSVGCPLPDSCQLYYVNRDTLFCYHKASEAFLQRIMSLYVSSHYKNTPNDLQLLSDAPAHHIFCLLPPVSNQQSSLPDVLCVLQVSLEGEISKSSIMNNLSQGKRPSGDLIPWTVSEQFQDNNFGSLSGARVVRIATHPDYQGMGYGSKAVELLQRYYEGSMTSLEESDDISMSEEANVVADEEVESMDEILTPRKNLPPLLWKLSERKPEKLDYIGVSYGLTAPLLKFWSKCSFSPVYLRQTNNPLTGEHSCVMIKALKQQSGGNWQEKYFQDFRKRFVSLLSFQFSSFQPSTALQVLHGNKNSSNKLSITTGEKLNKKELDLYFTPYDLQRLDVYSNNMADYHLIMDLVPSLAKLFFLNKFDCSLSIAQKAILLGIGLQHKSVDTVSNEIDLPTSQVLGLFNRTIRKLKTLLNKIVADAVEEELKPSLGDQHAADKVVIQPLEGLENELDEAAEEVLKKRDADLLSVLDDKDLKKYAIAGNDEAWENALSSGKMPSSVSIKSGKKRPGSDLLSRLKQREDSFKSKKKRFKKSNKGKKSL